MGATDQIFQNLGVLGFDNTSSTAITGKIAEAVGVLIDNTINEIENSESIITNLLISQDGYGKSAYYTANALAFQYGDNLVINTAINPVTGAPYLNLIYNPVDPTKQIIAQAAFQVSVTGSNSLLFLKVATLNAGVLGPLSALQLAAFQAYFLNFEIPGLPITIISIAANVLNFNSTCTYITSYDLNTLEANIASALITFQDTFPFNGQFFAGDLQDYIKTNVPGVRDFFIFNTTLDNIPFNGSQSLSAGYFNYAPNIDDNITYTPIAET